jgi:hypothetical protein
MLENYKKDVKCNRIYAYFLTVSGCLFRSFRHPEDGNIGKKLLNFPALHLEAENLCRRGYHFSLIRGSVSMAEISVRNQRPSSPELSGGSACICSKFRLWHVMTPEVTAPSSPHTERLTYLYRSAISRSFLYSTGGIPNHACFSP